MTAEKQPPAPADSGADGLRQVVAIIARLSSDSDELLSKLEDMEKHGLDLSELREQHLRAQRFIEQVGSVQAAQAIIYDEYIAAGGRESPEAQAEYEAATERNIALMPRDDLKWNPPPPPVIRRIAPDQFLIFPPSEDETIDGDPD